MPWRRLHTPQNTLAPATSAVNIKTPPKRRYMKKEHPPAPITELPVHSPPPLPFRLRRPGASSVTCAAYSVSCIPGTSPARGLVRQRPELQRYTPRDFCDSGGSAFVAMPPQIGAAHLVQAEPQCTCPSTPLLPNQGRGVSPLTPCTAGTSYHLLQCSRHPLAPLPAAAAAAGGAASRSGRVVDVLLAVSDNAGHGLFATVERVINQVLYARAHGLEPYVYVGERAFADGMACEHGPTGYFDAPRGDNVWECACSHRHRPPPPPPPPPLPPPPPPSPTTYSTPTVASNRYYFAQPGARGLRLADLTDPSAVRSVQAGCTPPSGRTTSFATRPFPAWRTGGARRAAVCAERPRG